MIRLQPGQQMAGCEEAISIRGDCLGVSIPCYTARHAPFQVIRFPLLWTSFLSHPQHQGAVDVFLLRDSHHEARPAPSSDLPVTGFQYVCHVF